MFQFLVYSIFIILMVFVKKKLPYFFKSANKSIVMQKKKKIIFAMESIMEKLAYILFLKTP